MYTKPILVHNRPVFLYHHSPTLPKNVLYNYLLQQRWAEYNIPFIHTLYTCAHCNSVGWARLSYLIYYIIIIYYILLLYTTLLCCLDVGMQQRWSPTPRQMPRPLAFGWGLLGGGSISPPSSWFYYFYNKLVAFLPEESCPFQTYPCVYCPKP